MKIYGLTLDEGSNIANLTTNTGASFPENGSDGEIFYLTAGDIGFYAHAQGVWHKLDTISTRTIVSGNHAAELYESYLGVRHSTAISIYLPAGIENKQFTIKDELGVANTNNITIVPNGSETIDGSSSLVLSTNYAHVTLYFGDAAWHII